MRLARLIGSLVLALVPVTSAWADTPFVSPSTSPEQVAEKRIYKFLETVPGLPKSIVVVPATGWVLCPNRPASDNVQAEVWTVLDKSDPKANPIMMFAVRPDTGEVFALFEESLKAHPTYR